MIKIIFRTNAGIDLVRYTHKQSLVIIKARDLTMNSCRILKVGYCNLLFD